MQARYIMNHVMTTWTVSNKWEEAYKRKSKDVMGRALTMQNALTAQIQRKAAKSALISLARLQSPQSGSQCAAWITKIKQRQYDSWDKGSRDALGRFKHVSNDYDTYYMYHSGNVSPARPGGAPPATLASGLLCTRSKGMDGQE